MNFIIEWPKLWKKWADAVSSNLIDGFWIESYEEYWPKIFPDGSLVYAQKTNDNQWLLLRENAWIDYGFENFDEFIEALLSKRIEADRASKIIMLGNYRKLPRVNYLGSIRGSILINGQKAMHFLIINDNEFHNVRLLAHKIDRDCVVEREIFFQEFIDKLKSIFLNNEDNRIKLIRIGIFLGFFTAIFSLIAFFWKKGIFLAILSQIACLWIFWRIGKE